MEQLLKAVLLGVVQGLTEWLPISSTGHLRLSEHFLSMTMPLFFDVILHVGTLIVVLIFFRKDIKKILSALVNRDFEGEHGKMVPLLIVGAIPTALIGLVFGLLMEDVFQATLPIALAFTLCGVILYSSKLGREKTENVSYLAATMIGIAQGVAIIPGISRSGATISIALLLGMKREKAFRFSLLLSIPAVLGALSLTAYKQFSHLTIAEFGWSEILIGALVAMFVSYAALKLLWKVLSEKKLHLFAFYCWTLGIVLIVLSLGEF